MDKAKMCQLHSKPYRYINTITTKFMCYDCRQEDFKWGKMESVEIEKYTKVSQNIQKDNFAKEISELETRIARQYFHIVELCNSCPNDEKFIKELTSLYKHESILELKVSIYKLHQEVLELQESSSALGENQDNQSLEQQLFILSKQDQIREHINKIQMNSDKLQESVIKQQSPFYKQNHHQMGCFLDNLVGASIESDEAYWMREEQFLRIFCSPEDIAQVIEIFKSQNDLINHQKQMKERDVEFFDRQKKQLNGVNYLYKEGLKIMEKGRKQEEDNRQLQSQQRQLRKQISSSNGGQPSGINNVQPKQQNSLQKYHNQIQDIHSQDNRQQYSNNNNNNQSSSFQNHNPSYKQQQLQQQQQYGQQPYSNQVKHDQRNSGTQQQQYTNHIKQLDNQNQSNSSMVKPEDETLLSFSRDTIEVEQKSFADNSIVIVINQLDDKQKQNESYQRLS